MKCQALAGELAKLRAEIARGPNDGDRDRRKELVAAADAIEEAIAHALGTPEQRVLEAAESQVEYGLKEALLEDAIRGTPGSRAAVEYQRTKLAALRVVADRSSPYTSEAEEKLARIVRLLVSCGSAPPLAVISDIKDIVEVDQ
jgi:hypothetical protein